MAALMTSGISAVVADAMKDDLTRLKDEDQVTEGDVTRAALNIGLSVMNELSQQLRKAEYGAAKMGEGPVWRWKRRSRRVGQ